MGIEEIITAVYGIKGATLIVKKMNPWKNRDIYVAYYADISGATMWFEVIDGQPSELPYGIADMINQGYKPI